jgi:hypothetical protein
VCRPCPCDRQTAEVDSTWKFDPLMTKTLDDPLVLCYYDNTPGQTAIQARPFFSPFNPSPLCLQACCYRNDYLVTSADGRAGPAYKFHPRQDKRAHREDDIRPIQWCCVKSDLCHLYHKLRPTSDCSEYSVPRIGSCKHFFCDPLKSWFSFQVFAVTMLI